MFELLKDVHCAICGGVVDDNNLFLVILLLQDGFNASLYEPATVVRHNGDGYVVVVGHAVFLSGLLKLLLNRAFRRRRVTPAFTRTQALTSKADYLAEHGHRLRDTNGPYTGGRARNKSSYHG